MLAKTLTLIWLLVLLAICLLESVLHRQSSLFREYGAVFMSLKGTLLGCFVLQCGTFLWLSFGRKDWLLIGLLLIALARVFFVPTEPGTAILVLVFGVALGRGLSFALKEDGIWEKQFGKRKAESGNNLEILNRKLAIGNFLIGLVGLLTFAAWWHLDMSKSHNSHYSGPRWMGFWDNPNTYGLLIGAGTTLAVALQVLSLKSPVQNPKSETRRKLKIIFLSVAMFMLSVGLVMSYSRGAWLATGIGFTYLAWCYGKLKWKYVAIGAGIVALGAGLVWGQTADSAPWYVKRADLGRPSAQHRATAWRAGLEIMRDHPLGVGWGNAIPLYGEKYHPPEGGPAALATNNYLMIGTELGMPALVCFAAYVVLCYRKSPKLGQFKVQNKKLKMEDAVALSSLPVPRVEGQKGLKSGANVAPAGNKENAPLLDRRDAYPAFQESEALRAACLAGALVFVVAFWFDGGLFTLPTASVFWILLELGAAQSLRGSRTADE